MLWETANALRERGTSQRILYRLTGLFYIDTDKHIWEKGHHRMELGLHFKNIMMIRSLCMAVRNPIRT